MYCKEKWRTAGGKGPLFGHVDGFQIDPTMVYNYNREKHAFDQHWTYLHKAYSHAGMSETAIADIYIFDKEEFNCTRRERERALVSLDSPNFEEGSCGLDLFALGYYTCDSYLTVPEKYAWIDQIQDEALYGRLLQLSGDDKKLLTLMPLRDFLSAKPPLSSM